MLQAEKLTIKKLNHQLREIIASDKLISDLEEKGITTLEHIRRNTGITPVKEWGPEDKDSARKLEAHAYLSLLSGDARVNEKLINAGFLNIHDISEATRREFVSRTKDLAITEEQASSIHGKAEAASAVLTNVVTGIRAERANGYEIEQPLDTSALDDVFPQQCECPDSESAVSPLAYLADLLQYTIKHVEIQEEGDDDFRNVTLEDLQERFHQPFEELPGSAEEVDRSVRQVRLCIEVLRRYLRTLSVSPEKQDYLAEKETAYAFSAYQVLLNQIGASYEALRLAKTADLENRKAVADRLGIELQPYRPDALDELLLNIEDVDEPVLERLFGLADTTRAARADSPFKFGSTPPGATNWMTYGARGIYVDVDTSSAGFAVTPVYLPYLVGEGDIWATTGATSVYHATRTGFRIYLRFSSGKRITPGFVNKRKWHIRWVAVKRGLKTHGVATGGTKPGATNWQAYPGSVAGIFLDIDTSSAGFTQTPVYLTSLGGNSQHWGTTGATSIYQATPNGFRVYVKFADGRELTPEFANRRKWHVQWLGIEPDFDGGPAIDPGFHTGFTRPSDWQQESDSKSVIFIDVDAKSANFCTTPIFLTSLVGQSHHWDTIGATSICQATRTGYRIYVQFSDGRILNPKFAEDKGWHIRWMGAEFGDAKFLEWRLQHLRSLWQQQDWSTGPYSENLISTPIQKEILPVIDPDIIGPEDFRVPDNCLPPFSIWLARRRWIDERLTYLRERRSELAAQGMNAAQILASLLAELNNGVTYGDTEKVPWLDEVTISEIIARKTDLQSGEDLESQHAWIAERHLSVDSFLRLAEIAEHAQDEDEVSEEQWEKDWLELDSILVQVQKRVFFETWRQEESETPFAAEGLLSLELDPRIFWIALDEPTEGPWSPALHDGRPHVDPENISLEKLVAFPYGAPARHLWQSRKAILDTVRNAIQHAYENAKGNKLEAALVKALGPCPTPPWTNLIQNTATDLQSHDEATREAAKKAVREQFHMSLDDFSHLVKVRNQAEDPESEPSRDDLDKLYTLLTSAQKRRTLLAAWAQEEETQDLSYWRVLKARSPLWRASPEVRQRWQQALKTHSSSPIIDPDLIGDDDLRDPIPDNPVHDILYSRKEWTEEQETKLRDLLDGDLASFSWGCRWAEDGQFQSPRGMAVDNEGYLYVADSDNNRIQKFDSHGVFLRKWGVGGNEPGQFSMPCGVAVDAHANVFVADTNNHRIQRFSSEGVYQATWGQQGTNDGELSHPKDVAVDSEGYVYVADTGNHRVQKFHPKGVFVKKWGGNGEGEFQSPMGIAADSHRNVYVADTEHHKIKKIIYDSPFIKSWGEEGNGDGQFRSPNGVSVDHLDDVYVADTKNHRVQKLTSEGEFFQKWGSLGSGDGQFNAPASIATEINGNVYVAEAGNHRIQCFQFDRLAGFRAIVRSALGVSVEHLLGLDDERKQGNDITVQLDQLGLPMAGLSYLIRTYELLVADAQVQESEWDDVFSILVQVRKRRIFAEWRKAEQNQNISLNPDFFQLSAQEPDLPPWRANREARWEWRDKLSARTDQERATVSAMAIAVDVCEEATLMLLRDALVEVCYEDDGSEDLVEKAKTLSDKLLIDCRAGNCQKTTRISQAITTIQNLIFSLRTEQLKDDHELLSMRLDPEYRNYEQEWLWIGSYETWKSAIGVFLYPENILLPTFRRDKTKQFNAFMGDLRKNNRRLTPRIAGDIAREYEKYLRDNCSLSVEDAVQDISISDGTTARRVYIIAKGAFTDSLYMSSYDPDDPSANAQGIWETIEGLEKYNVVDVVGAVIYAPARLKPQEKFIYLFLKVLGDGIGWTNEHKLILYKYNLSINSWDNEPLPLELPEGAYNFHAVVMKGGSYRELPHLALKIFKVSSGGVLLCARKILGNDWSRSDEEESWDRYIYENAPPHLIGMLKAGGHHFVLIAERRRLAPLPYSVMKFKKFEVSAGIQPHDWTALQGTSDVRDEKPCKGLLVLNGSDAVDVYVLRGTEQHTYYQTITIQNSTVSHDANHTPFSKNIQEVERDRPRHAMIATTSNASETDQILYASVFGAGPPMDDAQRYRSRVKFEGGNLVVDEEQMRYISPSVIPEFLCVEPTCASDDKKQLMERLFIYYQFYHAAPSAVLMCLEEGFYFVPMATALALQQSANYTAALDWFRAIYDYARPIGEREIYYKLKQEQGPDPEKYQRLENWLLDPLNVHRIASTRNNTYTRFTLLAIIRCLLDYADAEFTRDTVESLTKARKLYKTAVELLQLGVLSQPSVCRYLEIELREIGQNLRGTVYQGAWQSICGKIIRIKDKKIFEQTVTNVRQIMENTDELAVRIASAGQEVNKTLAAQAPSAIGKALDRRRETFGQIPKLLLKSESVERGIEKVILLAESARTTWPGNERIAVFNDASSISNDFVPLAATFPDYCIPPNPLIEALRFHAEINLHKLRTCRNIAGVKREIEAYAAPTDVLSAMPSVGPGGQLMLPTTIAPPPVPYRYEFLVERAKQLTNLAAQMEAAFLSALEKRDAELYNLLKARQDVQMARAGIRLQTLHLRQAQDEVKLAELQRESAEIQARTYQEWLEAGLNQWENRLIKAYYEEEDYHEQFAQVDYLLASAQALTSAAAAAPTSAGAAFASATVGIGVAFEKMVQASNIAGVKRQISVASFWATYERRAQEWQLQSEIAQHSIRIGDQQKKIATDGVNIAMQERNIARIKTDHAEEVVEFLNNKETNFEVYDWMSDVLEGVYSYFLQQGTAMAKLAQNQLAFERQEPPPAFIQGDYWEVPSENPLGGASENAVDRHGLTGSARLLADIYKLDQYRLETDKRKLQLTKANSLARSAPYEFQRFKETGVMTFATPMELFDRDFPGHYLRMIKRVRTSVIALVPPTQGIKATLSNVGVSRLVVQRNYLFQIITAHRPPESVALSSPSNATGMFELEAQPVMMLPFEGLGVDTTWEFRMPKAANPFDYGTIADIIVTIEYTALDSTDYRQQVIDTLPPTLSANRPFSFRHQYADQWYDLHNPDQTSNPMTVRFNMRREEFPPNLERLRIDEVTLYFAGVGDEGPEIQVKLAAPTGIDAGSATAIGGLISTRRGAWPLLRGTEITGEWQLSLTDNAEIRNLFQEEKIEDILFVITYKGKTPPWPQ